MISVKETYLVFIHLSFSWSIFLRVRTNGIKLFRTKQATVPGKNRQSALVICSLCCLADVIVSHSVSKCTWQLQGERSSSEMCLIQFRARHILHCSGNLGKGQSAYLWSQILKAGAEQHAVRSCFVCILSQFSFFPELFASTPQIHQRFI